MPDEEVETPVEPKAPPEPTPAEPEVPVNPEPSEPIEIPLSEGDRACYSRWYHRFDPTIWVNGFMWCPVCYAPNAPDANE